MITVHCTCHGDAGDSELEEPLLGNDGAGTDTHGGVASRGSRTEGAVVPYNAYYWADLLRTIVLGAASGLRTLQGTSEPLCLLSSHVHSWKISNFCPAICVLNPNPKRDEFR